MKENKYEELMFLSVIGEICETPYEMHSENFICFKPNANLSPAHVLYLTRNRDERDCVIKTRLNSFQKKMGLNNVITSDCGMNRLKSFAMSYMLNDKELSKDIQENCLNNLKTLEKREVLTEEQVNAMNNEFKQLVDDLQKSYNEQHELNF